MTNRIRNDFDIVARSGEAIDVITLASVHGIVTVVVTPTGTDDTVILPDGKHVDFEQEHTEGWKPEFLADLWFFLAEKL